MTVVVGYVVSPEGEAALERAVAEAARSSERLIVVHSANLPGEAAGVVSVEQSVDAIDERLRGQVPSHEVVLLSASDDPGEVILATAAAEQATLIVIGLRRRTPVGKLLMGSHSQRVLLGAECPVLAVKSAPNSD